MAADHDPLHQLNNLVCRSACAGPEVKSNYVGCEDGHGVSSSFGRQCRWGSRGNLLAGCVVVSGFRGNEDYSGPSQDIKPEVSTAFSPLIVLLSENSSENVNVERKVPHCFRATGRTLLCWTQPRTTYRPGAIAQCDLRFPEIPIPVGCGQERILPVLV